jgi:hypothetical protein
VSQPIPQAALGDSSIGYPDRRVIMVTSAGEEMSLADVVANLATVCAEVGQRVALVSTAGLAAPDVNSELPQSAPLWWKHFPSPGGTSSPLPMEDERERLLTGPLEPTDVEPLMGATGVRGVSRLDLRYFVGHPAQVVIRVPQVIAALRQIVDVVFLEVPSYISVHHGEGLTPLADVVLVVAEREETRQDEMRLMSAALRHLSAPVVGLALTDGGLEMYDWGRVEADRQEDHELSSDEREPTGEMPISGSLGVTPALPFEELPVVEHAPREV